MVTVNFVSEQIFLGSRLGEEYFNLAGGKGSKLDIKDRLLTEGFLSSETDL